jgi:hypothetical protein
MFTHECLTREDIPAIIKRREVMPNYKPLQWDTPGSRDLPPIIRLVANMTPVIPLSRRMSCFFAGVNPVTGRKVPSVKTYLKRIRRAAKVAFRIFLHG